MLYLGSNQIVDISPLSGLTNLTRLRLDDNQIVDISPLSSLTNLTMLLLNYNKIVGINSLSGLSNLSVLYLSNNQIVDILALVHNSGFGVGDSIDVRHNYLDLRPGSLDMVDIEALQGLGVHVDFSPQN